MKNEWMNSPSTYLAPRACEPLSSVFTRAVVADQRVRWMLVAAALQRKTADVVAQTKDSPASNTHPAFSGALQSEQSL